MAQRFFSGTLARSCTSDTYTPLQPAPTSRSHSMPWLLRLRLGITVSSRTFLHDECSDWLVQPLLGTSQDWKSDRVRQARRLSQSSRCLRCGIQLLYRKIERIYGLVSLPITVGVLFLTIYLGQDYITDLVAGVAVAAASVLVVTRLDRKRSLSSTILTRKL